MTPSLSGSAQVWMIPVPLHLVPWSTFWSLARSLNPQDWILETHLIDDVEEPVDDDEDLGYGVEALVDDGESLDGLKKH